MKTEEDGYFTFSDGTIKNLYPLGTRITLEQAEEILSSDVAGREEELNQVFITKGISGQISQQFYDAIFSLTFQIGTTTLSNESDLSNFLIYENFDLNNMQEIKEQFGEYSNNLDMGSMRRRADELDMIFFDDYKREYDETRYGDIWRKKLFLI